MKCSVGLLGISLIAGLIMLLSQHICTYAITCNFVCSTGTVYLNSSLSQLHSSSVKLSVCARDGEGLSAINPANITVNILHSHQPLAIFQKPHYTFFISEDAPVGSVVGLVQAVTPASEFTAITLMFSSQMMYCNTRSLLGLII